jgi:uncharacterized protein
MVKRVYWLKKLENAWKKRSIIWLSGVRRVGKTYLCQSLDNIEYFDCELPRTRHLFSDPEAFLRNFQGKRIVLDEIHRLSNPSELLKIASDHYSDIKIIATGSSTLGASKKFQDTLTGRKTNVHLTPMLFHEGEDFYKPELSLRLLYGGLPPFFMADVLPESDYQEWLSSYWAKDIQELFRVKNRHSFTTFTELLFVQSGSIFDATRFATPCEVTRPTIKNYLSVLEESYVAYVVRPFSTNASKEIISAPKVYGFDTGFVCHYRGWMDLQRENLGDLWEHIVINELIAQVQRSPIHYWRDKQGHEIDFIVSLRKGEPTTIECKWRSTAFDAKNLKIFRRHYPKGKNFVVATDIELSYEKDYGDLRVAFVSLSDLVALL